MGYARIFWINERPIRNYPAENEKDERFIQEVGRRVLLISAADSSKDAAEGSTLKPDELGALA